MENSTSGAIAGTRGIRVAQTDVASVKPWAHVRPAAVPGLPVITGPTAQLRGAEVCPSPDRFQVTPSLRAFQVMNAVTATDAPAFGANAQGYVPTIQGSIRPAPPG